MCYLLDNLNAQNAEAAGWCLHNGEWHNGFSPEHHGPYKSYRMKSIDGLLFDQFDTYYANQEFSHNGINYNANYVERDAFASMTAALEGKALPRRASLIEIAQLKWLLKFMSSTMM
jgi:hypothetical protein